MCLQYNIAFVKYYEGLSVAEGLKDESRDLTFTYLTALGTQLGFDGEVSIYPPIRAKSINTTSWCNSLLLKLNTFVLKFESN